MKKLKLYLETSVWNFYYADDAPEKKEITIHFFERVKQNKFNIFISEVVLTEISRAPDDKMNLLMQLINIYNPERLELTEEVLSLSKKYLDAKILPQKAVEDARHAAIATVHEIDALISWNLNHLANLQRMEKINGINLLEGYSKTIKIITPMEVLYD